MDADADTRTHTHCRFFGEARDFRGLSKEGRGDGTRVPALPGRMPWVFWDSRGDFARTLTCAGFSRLQPHRTLRSHRTPHFLHRLHCVYTGDRGRAGLPLSWGLRQRSGRRGRRDTPHTHTASFLSLSKPARRRMRLCIHSGARAFSGCAAVGAALATPCDTPHTLILAE